MGIEPDLPRAEAIALQFMAARVSSMEAKTELISAELAMPVAELHMSSRTRWHAVQDRQDGDAVGQARSCLSP